MIGFEFLNNRTRFIHSKDLDDMRTGVIFSWQMNSFIIL